MIQQLSSELFWDVDKESIDLKRHCRWLLERILHRGRWEDWLFARATFGDDTIRDLMPVLRIDAKTKSFLEFALNQ
jgi:hypothetical protein